MNKGTLMSLAVLALLSGLAWIALVHPPLLLALGMIVVALSLGGLVLRTR